MNTDLFMQAFQGAPTDHVKLSEESATSLTTLWAIPQQKKEHRDDVFVPTDLFLTGQVPLLDCRITINKSDIDPVDFRVIIFPEYQKEIFSNDKSTEGVLCGVIKLSNLGLDVVFGIGVVPNEDGIRLANVVLTKMDGVFQWRKSYQGLRELTFELMGIWYGVQIALLHPVVKTIFNNPKPYPMTTSRNSNARKKKHKVRYVKTHIISQNELDRLIYGDRTAKSYNRHALVWYVIGHWRTYHNGKKVFVQPHWKGALRETKISETREREIITTVENEGGLP